MCDEDDDDDDDMTMVWCDGDDDASECKIVERQQADIKSTIAYLKSHLEREPMTRMTTMRMVAVVVVM